MNLYTVKSSNKIENLLNIILKNNDANLLMTYTLVINYKDSCSAIKPGVTLRVDEKHLDSLALEWDFLICGFKGTVYIEEDKKYIKVYKGKLMMSSNPSIFSGLELI